MTVPYNLAVSTSKPWTLFKLLFRWRGSIWKSVLLELSVWLVLYSIISITYRLALSPSQRRNFEKFSHYCDKKLDYIPLNFMLGFFVTVIVTRWSQMFDNIGYIDNIGLMTAAYVRGTDDKSRMIRRNIVRYCVLSQLLVFRDISMRVRRRFPTMDTVVAAGFMMPHEKARFDEIHYRFAKYWLPFQWALALLHDARQQQKIASDILLQKVGEEIKRFRTGLAVLSNMDWVPLPIMYPQLVVLAVHTYFFVCLFSRQFILSDDAANKSTIDILLPFMTILQFVFYMGWMKIAEALLNPFGEDDDDFEGNFLLDKNLAIGIMIVDEGFHKPPAVLKDMFWNAPVQPLYSMESMKEQPKPSGFEGSTAHVKLPNHVKEITMMSLEEEDEKQHDDSDDATLVEGPLRKSKRRVSIVGVKKDDQEEDSNVLSNLRHRFTRSISRSHVPYSFDQYAKDNQGSFTPNHLQSSVSIDLAAVETGSYNKYRRSSQLSATSRILDALVQESDSYVNEAYKDDGEQMEGSGQTVGAVVFSQTNNESTARHQPSAISHSHSSLSRLVTAMPTHMLDDLVEELEDISPSAKNSFIEKDAKNDLPQQMEAISQSTNFVVGGTRRSPEATDGETSRTPLEAPQEGKQ